MLHLRHQIKPRKSRLRRVWMTFSAPTGSLLHMRKPDRGLAPFTLAFPGGDGRTIARQAYPRTRSVVKGLLVG